MHTFIMPSLVVALKEMRLTLAMQITTHLKNIGEIQKEKEKISIWNTKTHVLPISVSIIHLMPHCWSIAKPVKEPGPIMSGQFFNYLLFENNLHFKCHCCSFFVYNYFMSLFYRAGVGHFCVLHEQYVDYFCWYRKSNYYPLICYFYTMLAYNYHCNQMQVYFIRVTILGQA